MSVESYPQRCRGRCPRLPRPAVIGLVAALAFTVALVFIPTSAQAAEAVGVCNPTSENGCVNGILQDADQTPIAGATVTLSGQEGAETTTADDGTWAFSVEEDGDYTVTIDESVAEDYGLAASEVTVTVEKSSFTNQRAVVRFDQAASGSSSSSTSGSSSDSASSDSGDTDGSGTAEGEDDTSTAAATGDDEVDESSSSSSTTVNRVLQQLYSGIIFGLMLGMMSVGMNLIYGTTGLSSFSHGEQVTLGGLTAYVGVQMLGLPLWAAGILAVVVGALTGLLQNEIIWAPLRRRHVGTMQQMIVTIGLSMVLQYTFQFFFGGDIHSVVTSTQTGFRLGPITTNSTTLITAAISIVVIVGMSLFLYRTRLGRATRAVSDNAALASASGINVELVVRLVWVISCALAALSGVLMALYLNGVSWNTGAVLLLLMFSSITLGGLGTPVGALVGSLIIGIVVDMSSLIIPNDMRYASALVILIVVLLVRPQGIFGKQQRVG